MKCPRPQPASPSNGHGRHTVRRAARLLLALLALLSWVLVASGAPQHRGSDGPFEVADTSWEGGSDLFSLATERLGRERVQVVSTLDYSELTPDDGVLVLHPEVDLSFEDVTRFLRGGGRLAVADDHGRGDVLLKRFAIRRVPLPGRPALTLRDDPDLAIATPVIEVVAGSERGRHPVAAKVDQVVTNHATGLEHPQLTPILEVEAVDSKAVSFAVTGIIGARGRLLAIGDPSVFINLMLRYPGNRAFAEGVVDYLVGADDWGPRGGRLFIVANEFRQVGRFGGGSALLDDLATKRRELSEAVRDWHDRGLPDVAAWALAALAALLLSSWVVTRAARLHVTALPRFARPIPEVAQGGVAGRAHVLAAASTSRALLLVELKVALHEALAERLGVRSGETVERLVELCRERMVLGVADLDALRRVLSRLRDIERRVAEGGPDKVDEPEMNRLHEESMRLIRELSTAEEAHALAPQPAAGPLRPSAEGVNEERA